jgi:hypothetical protein
MLRNIKFEEHQNQQRNRRIRLANSRLLNELNLTHTRR